MDTYTIVGRKIDQGKTRYLHSDGSIDQNPNKNGATGTALTVEFIGKKIIELSQNAHLERGSPEYLKVTEQLRNALVVKGPFNHDPNDPKLEELLDDVTVELNYDERTPLDKNVRTLVIPAKDTLAYRETYFKEKDQIPGYEPPLTYELDRLMMRLYFNRLIKELVTEFTGTDGQPLSQADQNKMAEDVDKKLGSYDELLADAEDETELSMVRVLASPVAAFHRAIGIYITEMCD